MKTLYLLRHAQTLPAEGGSTDIERHLSPNGLSDAAALGRWMKDKGQQPSTILCSSAQRTRETLAQMLEHIEAAPTHYDEAIYHGGRGEYFAMIQNLDDKYDSALLVAHNPSIHALAVMLASDESSDTLMQQLATSYATGTMSILQCPCESWKNLQPAGNKLTDLLTPLDYNAPQTPARWM